MRQRVRAYSNYHDVVNMVRYGPYLILKHIWIQVVILTVMFFAVAIIYRYYQGLDWLTAFLGSVSTITTIGIYTPNIVTMPDTEKIYLIAVFIISVGSAASLVQSTVATLLRREYLMQNLDEVKAKNMRGHVIVMGYSFLGKYVTEKIKDLGLTSVVIAKDEIQAQIARTQGWIAIASPITSVFEALAKAGIPNARAVVVTYDDDGDNMLAVMSAKRLNPRARVITIVNERELAEGLKSAQADTVITPSDIIGQMLAVSTVSGEVAGAFTSPEIGTRGIADFEIKREGMKVSELERFSPVLLIVRSGHVYSSMGKDFELEMGDTVYVLTDHDSIMKLETFLSHNSD